MVEAGLGSLIEVETLWSIDDLFDANEYLDALADAREKAEQDARARAR